MDNKLGPLKAQAWRESGLLQKQACSLTGKWDAHLTEYKVFWVTGKDGPVVKPLLIPCLTHA